MSLISKFKAVKFNASREWEVEDTLTNEAALQILVNNEPFSVTMRTPGSEKDLVRGLLFAENAYDKIQNVFRYQTLELDSFGNPSVVNVFLSDDEKAPGADSKRSLTSVSSCGICGKEDLSSIALCGDPIADPVVFSPQQITKMFDAMAEVQDAFLKSGGCHAAAVFDANARLIIMKEDIGRHNAVDKVIGFCLNNDLLTHANCLLVSGRVSFEIISKAHRAGIPVLAAISAPSSLAVQSSRDCGITLLGFCRGENLTAYSGEERISV
ncbi:MAG: formate dehydrogenase accessory sulfurtransferase FdhD [Bacteroidetes bacterium]|nr:formate dehydrogenase accessory sulfurtransferase FdhD [Bacteroidota bacterium]